MKTINPKIKTIEDILKEFCGFDVQIPFYQREYVWNDRQIDTLFYDLRNLNDEHFFGTITTRKINSKHNEMETLRIIDGQQRITTAIIFLCATKKVLTNRNAKLSDENNLILANLSTTFNNTFNNDFSTLKKILKDNEINENNSYSNNFNYIYEKINSYDDEKQINLLLDNFLRKFKLCELCFSDYETSDEMIIFTSINSKGKPLEIFELFKSSLLLFCESNLLENKEEILVNMFNSKFNNVNHKEFEKFIESLYHYYLGKEIEGESNEKNRAMLEILKDIIKWDLKIYGNASQEQFEKILDFLSDFYKLFLSIKNDEHDKELHLPNISFITKMIPNNKKTPIYPLVYLFFQFNKSNSFENKKQKIKELILSKFIKSILPLVNHFILYGQGDSKIGRDYFKKINENKKNINDDIEKIIPSLENISKIIEVPIETIETKLAEYNEEKENWAIKFLLSLIDWFPNGVFKNGENIKLSNTTVHLEHIMPQTLTKDWKNYLLENNEGFNINNIESEHEDKLNRIGNFLLLSGSLNCSVSNKNFNDKKKDYSTFSAHSLLFNNIFDEKIDIFNKKVWTFDSIVERSKAISKFICEIFRTI